MGAQPQVNEVGAWNQWREVDLQIDLLVTGSTGDEGRRCRERLHYWHSGGIGNVHSEKKRWMGGGDRDACADVKDEVRLYPTEVARGEDEACLGLGRRPRALPLRGDRTGHGGCVPAQAIADRAVELQLTVVQQDNTGAEAADRSHIVADEKDRATFFRDGVDSLQTFALKRSVSHSEHFINDQYLWIQVSRDGEGEAHIHAAAVVFDWGVKELFNFGKGNDFIESAPDFDARHAEDGPIEVDVFPASKLWMEPGAHLKKTGNATLKGNPPRGGLRDAGKDFEQGGLACAIAPDDANDFTGLDFEGNVPQGPEVLVGIDDAVC